MKLIVRIDDVGFTPVHNLGSWKTIEQGIATAADVMLDTPGTEDALRYLRNCPWISVGWHTHFWGSPVLPEHKVPTMIREDGRFRRDLFFAADVSFEEVLSELRAELDRCIDILGFAPGYRLTVFPADKPFGRAMAEIDKEYGIVTGFLNSTAEMGMSDKLTKVLGFPKGGFPPMPAAPQWVDRKIFNTNLGGGFSPTDTLTDAMNGDPVADFLAAGPRLLAHDDYTWFTCWHPGYIDDYVLRGDTTTGAKYFIITRPIDAAALCDPRISEWIIEHRVVLVSFSDALYGTRNYQNHLRRIGSPLAV